MKNNHGNKNPNINNTKKRETENTSLNKNSKAKNANVKIPCDLCNFVGKSASDYTKHIQEHDKEDSGKSLPCDLSYRPGY